MPSPNAITIAAALIKEFEGYRPRAYPDPASPLAKATRKTTWGYEDAREVLATLPKDVQALSGSPWTVGYGTTIGVWLGTAVTREEADKLLREHIEKDAKNVAKHVAVPLNDHEWAAILSFAYNIGSIAFATSTLAKKLNRGDKAGAAAEFGRWVHAQGKKMPGLVKRRERERDVFLGKITYSRADAPDGHFWVVVKP